jgi:hypothetical protein
VWRVEPGCDSREAEVIIRYDELPDMWVCLFGASLVGICPSTRWRSKMLCKSDMVIGELGVEETKLVLNEEGSSCSNSRWIVISDDGD